jgi:hypothetical protein
MRPVGGVKGLTLSPEYERRDNMQWSQTGEWCTPAALKIFKTTLDIDCGFFDSLGELFGESETAQAAQVITGERVAPCATGVFAAGEMLGLAVQGAVSAASITRSDTGAVLIEGTDFYINAFGQIELMSNIATGGCDGLTVSYTASPSATTAMRYTVGDLRTPLLIAGMDLASGCNVGSRVVHLYHFPAAVIERPEEKLFHGDFESMALDLRLLPQFTTAEPTYYRRSVLTY